MEPPVPKTGSVVTDQDMADVIAATLSRAKQGDMAAALLIERVWRLRDRTIALDLPAIIDARSVAEAQARVLAAVAQNRVTPRAGRDVSTIIEHRRRTLETVEYEDRLSAIERDHAQAETLREKFQAEVKAQLLEP
jgi:hypothetical protein